MTPFFSVILPIYNVAPYLERCIQSVLNQTFADYELILVDDGSTDSSPQICDGYASESDRIHVVHKENGGLSSARNAGMQQAKGRYIWWVDSDDWIEKDALAQLYQAAAEENPDVIKFSYFRSENGENKETGHGLSSGEYAGADALQMLREQAFLSAGTYCLSAWSHVYRTDFLKEKELLFVSERAIGSEDYLFNLQVLLSAEKVCVLPVPLYYYELRMGSLTQRYKTDLPQKYTKMYTMLKTYYEQHDGLELYGSYIDRFYVWHLLRGTCIPNEYHATQDHTLKEGRKNVRAFMGTEVFAEAVRNCETKDLSWKKRLQLRAMSMGIEWVFYWLFGLKPRIRRRKNQ